VTNGAYYLTPDGLVNFLRIGDPLQVIPVIDTRNLQFTLAPSGKLALSAERSTAPNLSPNNTGGIRNCLPRVNCSFYLTDLAGFCACACLKPAPAGWTCPWKPLRRPTPPDFPRYQCPVSAERRWHHLAHLRPAPGDLQTAATGHRHR